MSRTGFPLRFGFVVLLVLLVGCQASTGALPSPAGPPGAADRGPHPGSAAPDFRLPAPDGKVIGLSELRGKPVLINFWATWCGPCRLEMPDIEAAYQANQDKGLVVLAVNLEEDGPTAQEFVKSLRLSFPIVLDEEGEVAVKYRVTGLPMSFFVDRQGVIRELSLGAMTRDLLERRLAKIL